MASSTTTIPHWSSRSLNPEDLTFWYTASLLEDFNNQDFEHKADPLLIEALSLAPSLFYEWDTTPAVHCLVRAHTFIKVQLKLKRHMHDDWRGATFMLKDGGRWIPFKDWLQKLPPSQMRNFKQGVYNAQWDWWRSMRKPFRFLDLPEELQRRILLFALGEHVEPRYETIEVATGEKNVENLDLYIQRNRTSITKGTYRESTISYRSRRWRKVNDPTQLPWTRSVNLGLLCLSRDLRALALNVLWADTTKRYRGLTNDAAWFSRTKTYVTPRFLPYLRRVQLSFTYDDFTLFFQVPIKPRVTGSSLTTAWVLKELPALRYLELHFQSTNVKSYSPWSTYVGDRGEVSDWLQSRHPLIDPRIAPCVKILADWILAFAADYVEDVHVVRLTGFIKSAITQKWEAILNDKTRVDYARVIEEEQDKVKDLYESAFPPRCFCPQACGGFKELDKLMNAARGAYNWEWEKAYDQYKFDFDDIAETTNEAVLGARAQVWPE